MDFHPIWPVINVEIHWDDAQFHRESTQWISTQFDHPIDPIRSGIISMDFHPIQPVINVEIHWDDAQFDRESSQWISTQFDQ